MIPMAPGFFRPQISGLPPGGVVGLWLDASDSSTITLSGSNVTGWKCKVTNEDFVQGTSGYQPSIDTTHSVFPLDCVDFECGAGDSRWLGPVSAVTMTIPFTCFMVAQWPYYGPPYDYWALGIYNSQSASALVNGSRSLFAFGTPALLRSVQILSNSPTGYSYRNGNVGSASAEKAILSFVVPTTTPADTEIEYAGSPITESVSGSFGSTFAFIAVGSPDATYKSKGLLAEVICYEGAMGSTNKALVTDYLTDKWGL